MYNPPLWFYILFMLGSVNHILLKLFDMHLMVLILFFTLFYAFAVSNLIITITINFSSRNAIIMVP